jgi:hypothetical protein
MIVSFANWTKAAFLSGPMGNESVTRRFMRSRTKDHLLDRNGRTVYVPAKLSGSQSDQ